MVCFREIKEKMEILKILIDFSKKAKLINRRVDNTKTKIRFIKKN